MSDISIALDPFAVAVGTGLLASVVAGKGLVYGLDFVPQRWRKTVEWSLVGGAAVAAILGDLLSKGPWGERAFAFLLATLPGVIAYVAWRTMLASAVVSLVPFYFAIGSPTPDRTLHAPLLALDRAVYLQPAWELVYSSLGVFVLLPLLVVRQQQLFRRALKAYLMVLIVAYVGFLAYPTVGPRPAKVIGEDFFAWWLRLNYSLDWRYNCFPSLHVAHAFVSALTSYRVHNRVGFAALCWASLVGISTLYTKQHYAVDVIAGALIAYVAYVLFLRGHPRDTVADADRRQAPRRALGVIAIYGILVVFLWVLYQTGMVVV
jgi:membrane-associated phospholipid phosphatase